MDGPLHPDESIDLIKNLVCHSSSTTIVIDALDECDPETRHILLSSFENIMRSGEAPVRIFVSSRDDKDISLCLQDVPNLYIKASDNAEDIKSYVHYEVDQAIKDKSLLNGNISKEMYRKVIRTLTEKAQGM